MTKAFGSYGAAAEGRETEALGQTSHAQGFKTIAKGRWQDVMGGGEALYFLGRGGAERRLHHDQRYGRRPHDDGYCHRHDEHLGVPECVDSAGPGGKHHAYRNDEEHDTSAEIQ